jgi:Domain of unknown function (DUF5665)
MADKKTNEELTAKEFEAMGRDFWRLYEMNYKTRGRMYLFTFGKGVAQGFGIFLGGTILVAVLLYSLSFFDEIPLVEKIYNALTDPTSVKIEQQ